MPHSTSRFLTIFALVGCSEVGAGLPEPQVSTDLGTSLDMGEPGETQPDSGIEDFGPPDMGPPPRFVAGLAAERLAEALCTRSARCSSLSFEWTWPNGPNECRNARAERLVNIGRDQRFRAGFDELQVAIEAERVRFDAQVFERCLAELSSNSCSAPDPQACRSYFVGTQLENGLCLVDEECAGDNFCLSTVQGTCGVCRPRHALGESCERFGACQAPSFCGIGRCVIDDLQEGDRCPRFLSTRLNRFCASDLYCAGENEEGTCVPFPKAQDSCSLDLPCAYPFRCIDGLCIEPSRQGLGQGCSQLDEACFGAFACSPQNGSLVCVPPLEEGAPCSQRSDCANGLLCIRIFEEPICIPVAREGELCQYELTSNSNRCEQDTYCKVPEDMSAPTCERFRWTSCQ